MYSISILSASTTILKMIEEMLLGFADIFSFKKSEDLIEFLEENKSDFLIIDRTVGNESAKEIIKKISLPPPTLLLVSNKYDKENDGEGYAFILRKPFRSDELREVISYLFFAEISQEKDDVYILIVDDSDISRQIIKSKISLMGYEVLEASDGKEALNTLNNSDKNFSLIITDHEMPEMTGIELAKNIREFGVYKDIPIIMTTSLYENLEIRKDAFTSGINEFLPKPFDENHLQKIIRNLIHHTNENKDFRIILIDDSNSRRRAMASVLKSVGFHVITTNDSKKFIELVEDNDFDLALVDFILDKTTGIELIKILREKIHVNYPIIIYTAFDNIHAKKRLTDIYEAGANDYLLAPFEIEELIFKIKTWINYYTLLKESERKEKLLKESMTYDLLTGVLNRFNILKRGEEYFSLCKRKNSPLAILYMDIDHFKKVNDTYGHDTGDIVLKEFAKAVNKNIRAEDALGRLGGEEFLAILPFTDKEKALVVANKLREIVSEIKFENIPELKITVSIGLASFQSQKNIETFDKLITTADKLLYEAKQSGRNKVVSN